MKKTIAAKIFASLTVPLAALSFAGWIFNVGNGLQGATDKVNGVFALAVRPGQVAAVPEPTTTWLLGLGLIGLMGITRRRWHYENHKNLFATITLSVGLLTATGANAALIAADGGQTVYDTDLNISWLANVNLARSNTFSVAGIDATGYMDWSTAQSWIGAMNTANYLGYNNWRLPTTLQPDPSCGDQSGGISYGYNCAGSEMGHLFYNELGGAAGSPIGASSDPDLALFQNVLSHVFWSSTDFVLDTTNAWGFSSGQGTQYTFNKTSGLYALAVRPGQVAAVPEPSTTWLLGLGILGLMGVARRSQVTDNR